MLRNELFARPRSHRAALVLLAVCAVAVPLAVSGQVAREPRRFS